MSDLADTICASSTPPGRSGIAVVRLSGPQSLPIVRRLFLSGKSDPSLPPRTLRVGKIVDPRDGSEIDEGMVSCFCGPHSYTGEDMAEFSLHGNPVLVAALLDCLCALGARLAEPGEFTLRAFLRGRMDLTQAEAVRDIIEAKTLFQARTAGSQRAGSIAREIRPIKDLLIDSIVHLESAVEFVEENLPVASRDALAAQLAHTRRRLEQWIDSYHQGRLIRDGLALAIVGRPNVGKSSLFNALLARDRSIVTEIPGTTRDLVSEYTNIGGIPVHLQDTAGLHASEDPLENLGMQRSRQALADADSILLVADASREHSEQDDALRQQVESLACIVVLNKTDLPPRWTQAQIRQFAGNWPLAEVSAKTGAGIAPLRALLQQLLCGHAAQDEVLITNLRHCQALQAAAQHLARAEDAVQQALSEEFVLMHLHKGLESLGEITGETHVEDLLTEIFSRFCIGK